MRTPMMIEDTPTPVLFPEEMLDPPIQTRSYGMTDVGLIRPRNEDNFECDDEHMFFVVADGMGGETRGDLASRIAVDAIRETFVKSDDVLTDPARLERGIYQAQIRICNACVYNPKLTGMGTTVVGLLVESHGTAHISHIGDSRAYLLRNGVLEILTRDHTVAAQLEASGLIAAEPNHPLKHVLTRALSVHQNPKVETSEIHIARGDVFLLCSDGLSNMLSHEEIQTCLQDGGAHEEICRRLIDQALEHGGRDNITAIVIEIV